MLTLPQTDVDHRRHGNAPLEAATDGLVGAIHLVTARSNDISAGELRTWLRIEKNSARLLKQKLDRLISAEHQWFESLVAVGHIQIRHHSGHCLIILAALEVNSDHIRLAAVSDGSPGAIENFILANVKPGTTLLDSKYRGLPGYDYQFIGLGTRFQNIQQVLSLAETWVNQSGQDFSMSRLMIIFKSMSSTTTAAVPGHRLLSTL